MAEESQNVTPNENTTNTDVAKYNLETLVNSGAFSFTDRSILQVMLNNEKQYSLDEVKQTINDFKGGK